MDWLETTRRLRSTRYVGCAIEGHEAIASTNARALAWTDAPTGAVVVADRQTAGRGRFGRSWEGGEGASLLVSIVLRPQLTDGLLGLLPPAAGLAVCDSVAAFSGTAPPALKWPNDVLIGGRKCAGILVESSLASAAGARDFRAVLGIGINANQESMPPGLGGRAISLREASGAVVPRPILLADLLQAVEARVDQLERSPDSLVDEYQARLTGLDESVVVSDPAGRTVRGRFMGIDPNGGLRLLTESGVHRVFTSGEVTLCGSLP